MFFLVKVEVIIRFLHVVRGVRAQEKMVRLCKQHIVNFIFIVEVSYDRSRYGQEQDLCG